MTSQAQLQPTEASTRTALVTGAAQGIGRAVALRLAKDGYNVAINDIQAKDAELQSLSEEIAKLQRKVLVVPTDISNESLVVKMINKVAQDLGGLDVLVANAGLAMFKPILECTLEDWDRIYNVNARGTFLCYKYAAKQMIAQGRGGRIIGASSDLGRANEGGFSAYGSTKSVVRSLTQCAAKEWGPHGITVNSYTPGAINTEMTRRMGDALGGWSAVEKYEADKTAVGYVGTPEEIASVVSFLAKPESHFITGQSISSNGGRTCF